uniref:Uncharacterized protein n=1 Tax=Spironucleus salmonicida TaxID=348837 RepID=V6LYG2_9EUKA|eukprot:EST45849.1 Hypothetical protein SS50377_14191 [Spironucleus salmonicida]
MDRFYGKRSAQRQIRAIFDVEKRDFAEVLGEKNQTPILIFCVLRMGFQPVQQLSFQINMDVIVQLLDLVPFCRN